MVLKEGKIYEIRTSNDSAGKEETEIIKLIKQYPNFALFVNAAGFNVTYKYAELKKRLKGVPHE